MYTTSQIILSNHANHERMQQRGVETVLPQLWIDYGVPSYQHNGRIRWHMTRASFERMLREGVDKSLIILAEKKRNLCVITNSDASVVVTVVQDHRNRQNYRYSNATRSNRRTYH